jgi:hypothetical protein
VAVLIDTSLHLECKCKGPFYLFSSDDTGIHVESACMFLTSVCLSYKYEYDYVS